MTANGRRWHRHLIVFGLGYTGAAVAQEAAAAGIAVTATSRDPAGAARIAGVTVVDFAAAGAALANATHMLATAPPPGDGGQDGEGVDPVLHAHAGAIARGPAAALGRLSVRPPASTATAAAAGWTRPRRPRQGRSAAAAGSPPSRHGQRSPTTSRWICFASPASTGPAARRWTTCAPAGRAASSALATPSAASIATTSLPPCSPPWASRARPACAC